MKPIKYVVMIPYSEDNYFHITGNYTPGKPAIKLDPPVDSDFEITNVCFMNKNTGVFFDLKDLPEDLIDEISLMQYMRQAHDIADEAYYDSQQDF